MNDQIIDLIQMYFESNSIKYETRYTWPYVRSIKWSNRKIVAYTTGGIEAHSIGYYKVLSRPDIAKPEFIIEEWLNTAFKDWTIGINSRNSGLPEAERIYRYV